MSQDNPYRAAGAFRGKAYIRRDADAQLVEQIHDNQYYPYFAAPRQSGKSSLLIRTMAALDPGAYRCALVDLSPFVVASYDDFWRQFLHEVARSANFDPTPIATEDPRDVFLQWLRSCKQRLIVFMDEIDVLLNVDCREQIFSKFRTFFNMRARPDTATLERLQFVLAGAAHSSRFIKDPRWSPFNVAIEIELEDLTPAQVSQLSAYLGTAGAFAGPDLTNRVFELTGGSVYLCQLMFEQLWNTAARGNHRLGAADVDTVVDSIVAESPRNIHFYNIFRLVTADARLTMLFRRLTDGQELGHEEAKELRLTGICRGANPFRNAIYARVFGPGGPLDLKVGSKQIELGKQLDAALARRERLRGDPSDATAASAAELEIRRLRREFREGTSLQVGDVLGRGRWRVDERIGQGGFATVWRAFDGKTQREVAIKVLHGQFAEDRSRRDRFFRGAWKMSELKHPGIVEVVEPYGEESGYYYFVMEYLRDGTLHEAVLQHKPDVPRILRIVSQIGQALQYAHVRGLVHRDVKPSNVLVAGEAGKLTDFDLVRETDITGGTKTGAMGTFLYAAPEVMSRPQEADARADIYGLGMTAVFALHGADLAMDVIRDTDRFIDKLQCAAEVRQVLKTAVAWDREHRYVSSAEFVAALEQAGKVEARRIAVGPDDSQRASMSEWGAPPGDSVLLGLRTKRAPAASPGSAAPPAAAPSASSSFAPNFADDDEMEAAQSLSVPADMREEEAPQAPSPPPAAAPRLASAAVVPRARPDAGAERSPRRAVSSAPVAALQDPPVLSGAGAAALVRASAVRASHVDELGAGQVAEVADKSAVPTTRSMPEAVDASAVPTVRSAASSVAVVREQPVAVPPAESASGRVWMLATVLAACLALFFIAKSVWAPDIEGSGELVAIVPGTKAEMVAKDGERDAVEKGDPPRSSGEDLTASAGLAGSEVAASAGPGEAGAGDGAEVGASAGPVVDTGGPDRPTLVGPLDPPHTTDTVTATAGHDTGGSTVQARPIPAQAKKPTADELTRDGCSEVYFGSAEKALTLLMEAHELKPKDLRMLECLGRANMALNRYEAAGGYYQRILELESRSRKGLLGAAEAAEKLSRLGNASAFYDQLRAQEPNNPSAAKFFAANPQLDTRANLHPR